MAPGTVSPILAGPHARRIRWQGPTRGPGIPPTRGRRNTGPPRFVAPLPEGVGRPEDAQSGAFERPERLLEVLRLEAEEKGILRRVASKGPLRGLQRRAQIVLRRLLNEPGPEPHDLLRPQSELLPGCGPLLVRRDVEPVHVDPPTNPADSLPAKPELEQTPLVCVRERDDRVEAREAGLEEQIVQRTIRLVRPCGDRQRDVGEGEPERRHGRPVILDEMDDVGTEAFAVAADRADDPRKTDRLAHVVVRPGDVPVGRVEAKVGSQVHRDRGDPTERETSVRNILDHRRHDFEAVAEPLEPAEHVEPEVLVSGVTERQNSRPDDEDPQVLPPPNDRYPDALFEIRFSPRTTSDGTSDPRTQGETIPFCPRSNLLARLSRSLPRTDVQG